MPFLLAITLAAASVPAPGQVLFVDQNAPGANDGTGWTDAFLDLQSALDAAQAGAVIRVADGSYVPSALWVADQPTSACFALVDGVAMVGGYAGAGAPDPDERDLVLHPSILDGLLDGAGSKASHVVRAEATGEGTVLDGFTITNGLGKGPFNEIHSGGGLLILGGRATVRACTFVENQSWHMGGAAAVILGECSFTDCSFRDNDLGGAGFGGGALYGAVCSVTLSGCTFEGNHTSFTSPAPGGAIFLEAAGDLSLDECSFVLNWAALYGGAIEFSGDELFLRDCSFIQNGGLGQGGAIDAHASHLQAVDCLFLDNNASPYPMNYSSSGHGGAIFTTCRSNLLVNCRFIGNRAYPGLTGAPQGGALLVAAGGAHLVNCLLSGNVVSDPDIGGGARGGGVHAVDGQANFINCTLAGNRALPVDPWFANALGGGAYGNCSFSNCILWGNTDMTGTGESAQASGSIALVDHTCWHGWSGALGGPGSFGADPLFVDADGPDDQLGTADDDLRLAAGSPCVDAGSTPAALYDSVDLDGDGVFLEPLALDLGRIGRLADDPAVTDTGIGSAPVVDMGAYERSAWSNLAHALAGTQGKACLVGHGTLLPGSPASIHLTQALANSVVYLCAGFQPADAPFKGGTMVPDVLAPGFAMPFVIDALGTFVVETTWPAGVPAGLQTFVQCWFGDAQGPQGAAASNAVVGTAP